VRTRPQRVPPEHQEPGEARVGEIGDPLEVEYVLAVAALFQAAGVPEIEAEAEVEIASNRYS
jgi:hypothetical protein